VANTLVIIRLGVRRLHRLVRAFPPQYVIVVSSNSKFTGFVDQPFSRRALMSGKSGKGPFSQPVFNSDPCLRPIAFNLFAAAFFDKLTRT